MFYKYYLAYGSNLNIENMKSRCRFAKRVGEFTLDNYRLIYKGADDNFSYLTIEEANGYFVPMGIYKISLLDIPYLDMYEGYPSFYKKATIPITIEGKTVNAFVYVMNDEFDYHLPSSSYVKTCVEGYNDFGFNQDTLRNAYFDTLDIVRKRQKRLK